MVRKENFRKQFVKHNRDVVVKIEPFDYAELEVPAGSRILSIGPISAELQQQVQKTRGSMGVKSPTLRGALREHLEFLKKAPERPGINLILIHFDGAPLNHRRWTLINNKSYALPIVCKRESCSHYSTQQLHNFCEVMAEQTAKVTLPEEVVKNTYYGLTDGKRVVIIPASCRSHSAIQAYRVLYNAFYEVS